MPATAKRQKKGFRTVFALGFAALILGSMLAVFDSIFIQAVRLEGQARAHWEEVPCVVTKSKVEVSTGGDSRSYTPVIHFKYRFEGRDYIGKEYSFLRGLSAGRGYAYGAVEKYPEGAKVTAYVNPSVPGESVLSVDGSAFPRFALLLLLPFHLIALGFAFGAVSTLRHRIAQGHYTDVEYKYIHLSDEHHFVLRKRPMGAILCFVGLLAVIVIPVGMVLTLAHADGLAPGALAASAVGAALWTRHLSKRAKAPANFLYVDREQRTFAYPADAEPIALGNHCVIDVESKATSLTVNDQRVFRHKIQFGEGSGAATMFEFKGYIEEGEELRGILERELCRDMGTLRAA